MESYNLWPNETYTLFFTSLSQRSFKRVIKFTTPQIQISQKVIKNYWIKANFYVIKNYFILSPLRSQQAGTHKWLTIANWLRFLTWLRWLFTPFVFKHLRAWVLVSVKLFCRTLRIQFIHFKEFNAFVDTFVCLLVSSPGPMSGPVQVKTQQGVPSQPSNFRAVDIGENTVTLQWSKPTHSSENIVHYELYYVSIN